MEPAGVARPSFSAPSLTSEISGVVGNNFLESCFQHIPPRMQILHQNPEKITTYHPEVANSVEVPHNQPEVVYSGELSYNRHVMTHSEKANRHTIANLARQIATSSEMDQTCLVTALKVINPPTISFLYYKCRREVRQVRIRKIATNPQRTEMTSPHS